ncbi:MAG: aldehyde dehydrogenase family protein [Deinococcus sp.]|nr:aldehyde dehydrogenase family protein [Deinococcus sp.]
MEKKIYLSGQWKVTKTKLEVRSPYDGSVVGHTYRAGPAEIEEAIASAVVAFQQTRKLPSHRRAELLFKVSEGIRRRREELARTLAQEAGKPLKSARGEVDRAANTFAVAAEEAKRIEGHLLPLDLDAASAGRWGILRRFPLGPIAGISPFNFPLNLVAHKVAPALAAGNSIIIKPASATPFSALNLAEIVHEAGAVPGAFQVIPCAGRDAGALVEDPRIKMLTFTGSAEVGWGLKARAGKKRVTLELGGNAATIVHHDADLERSAERCTFGGFSFAGQSCISVQRIYVHERVFNFFMEKFVPKVQALRLGDPLEEATDLGPLIDREAAEKAKAWIDEAVAGGAKVATGGKLRGAMLEPTVLVDVKPDMKVSCQEAFAPLVTVVPYKEVDEVLALVNDSAYGLQAGLFTYDLQFIWKAYEEIEVGGLMINDVSTYRIDHMPYGGVKDSGLGREGLRYAIEEMTELKLLGLDPRLGQ